MTDINYGDFSDLEVLPTEYEREMVRKVPEKFALMLHSDLADALEHSAQTDEYIVSLEDALKDFLPLLDQCSEHHRDDWTVEKLIDKHRKTLDVFL